MIKNPLVILLVLFLAELILLNLHRLSFFRKLLDIIPVIFFLFATGMVLANAGVIDRGQPVIQQSIDLLLPMALFLMLVTVDIRSILHLGPMALTVFFAGTLGVMVGMVAAFAALKPIIGSQFATGFGALTGSWTGGSANMIAVKESLIVPNSVFTLMVVIDSIIPYVWMGLLVFLCPRQHKIDIFHGAEHTHKIDVEQINASVRWHVCLVMIGMALALSLLLNAVDGYFPVIKGILSPFTWVIILVTTIALWLGTGPVGHWAKKGLGLWGQWVLFFVLICIGTRGDLSQIKTVPWLLLGAMIVLVFHGLAIYTAGRLVKAPMFLMVTASQANLGGVASASMLAEIYRPGMASIGLLMAILGNIVGTYAGIITGQICLFLAR